MQALSSQSFVSIGVVARRTGLAVSAIRYYEEVGLLAQSARSEGGHRVFSESVVEVLTLVRQCRDIGFGIDATKALMTLAGDAGQECDGARDIAVSQLAAVRSKMEELRRLEQSLSRFVKSCGEQCAGGPAPNCCIFEDLRSSVDGPRRA